MSGAQGNESIWDSAAPGWAKWEFALAEAAVAATDRMLDAAGAAQGMTLLDLASGAGSQTLRAARRVGPSGKVIANDIASAMLGFVEANARAEGLDNVETLHGPAEGLAARGLRIDAATCRLGLMLFAAPGEALAAVRQALVPGGRFAALVIAAPQANPMFSKSMAIALRHAGISPPPPGSPGLFALSDPAALQALFTEAGYADVSVEPVTARLSMASTEDALTMMQEAFGAYRAVLSGLDEAARAAAWTEIGECLQDFATPNGIEADMALLLASGANPPD